jgi:NAD(P)-dependent dehydrogenase (short-subunit alcohol dehydrogenase family)
MASSTGTILLIGASRGLGLGLAEEYLARGWHVIATARDPAGAPGLAKLAETYADQLRIEATDVTAPDAGPRLAARLAGTALDVIFVVAGQSKAGRGPMFQAKPEVVAQEFLTNSFAPPVVAEALLGLLAPGGTVVFMTSVLGSLANAQGMVEIYSASKAALNMLGIGFARRHPDLRTILMHPGWVKTDMGGDSAPLDVATSAKGMADVIAREAGKTGVAYLDYAGKTIQW